MSLTRSAWAKCSPENKFTDYILILPDQGMIVSFTSMQTDEDKRVVWGCWIREEEGSVVYTALRKSKRWRRESYEIRGDQLIWNNGNGRGAGTWTKIEESDIPKNLRDRGVAFLEKFAEQAPPEYNEQNKSEQDDAFKRPC